MYRIQCSSLLWMNIDNWIDLTQVTKPNQTKPTAVYNSGLDMNRATIAKKDDLIIQNGIIELQINSIDFSM